VQRPIGNQTITLDRRIHIAEDGPNAALSSGTRTVERTTQGSVAVDAVTLTNLDGETVYRLTYWYEVGDNATGSWVGMKWNRALALLCGRDSTVTVVSELEKLSVPR